jgi:protein-L-isoaspartate O-methyltransferase
VRKAGERYFTEHEYPKIWVRQIRRDRVYSLEECAKVIDLLGIRRQEKILEVGTGPV